MLKLATIIEGVYSGPSWSPDGSQIVVQFEPRMTIDYQFISLQPSNKEQQTLTVLSTTISPGSKPVWLDENTLVYIHRKADLMSTIIYGELVFYNLVQDTTEIHVHGGSISDISINRSAGLIAMARSAILKEHYRLVIYDIATDSTTTLFDPPENSRIEDVAWNPQGTEIAFTLVTERSIREEHLLSLKVINVETQEVKTLFGPSVSPIDSPTWSPDGKQIALRIVDKQAGYQSGILLMSTDGSNQQIINLGRSISPVDLDWSPVSNELVFTSLGVPGDNALYLLDLTPWLTGTATP